jgi:flagellar hook-associated protein 1 FlgK
MSGIGSLFDIGRSALLAYQRALQVTGQNVSNVNTPGYSRQTAVLTAGPPATEGAVSIGTGVQVQEIRRAVDGFIAGQLVDSQSSTGRFQASRDALFQTQGFFQDASGTGISAGMSDFFNAIQDVANNPSDRSARSVLLAQAQTLAGQFNQAASNIQDQRRSLDGQVQQTIGNVNDLATQIADLNTQIAHAETGGQPANDLRDQRDTLIQNLAQQININTLEDATGQVTVFVGRGQTLVSQGTAASLVGTPNAGNSGYVDVQFLAKNSSTPVTISSVITNGSLKGLLDVRDTNLPNLLSSLDTLAGTLVTQVNQIHQSGYGLDGSTGQAFFNPTGTTAATISVALTDPQQIAASATATGIPGDNTNALALAGLQAQTQSAFGGITPNAFYAQTMADLGSSAQQADQQLTAQSAIHDQLQAHQAQVSGVSLNEELVNMLQYQRAFEAASKVITTTDQLLQTILAMKQ